MARFQKIKLDSCDAIFFDCDGTIAETEVYLTLKQFNAAFKSRDDLSHIQWDLGTYGNLLRVGASQARFSSYFDKVGWPSHVTDKRAFAQEMKELKDSMFGSVWAEENIPALPGVVRLIDEAFEKNIKVGVCSNSNHHPVSTICRTLFGESRASKMLIICGDNDLVAKRKPAPDMYLLAAQMLGVSPSRCWVVEDSEVGLAAACAAGMRCVVTPSFYTKSEDFSRASYVVPDLDAGGVSIGDD